VLQFRRRAPQPGHDLALDIFRGLGPLGGSGQDFSEVGIFVDPAKGPDMPGLVHPLVLGAGQGPALGGKDELQATRGLGPEIVRPKTELHPVAELPLEGLAQIFRAAFRGRVFGSGVGKATRRA